MAAVVKERLKYLWERLLNVKKEIEQEFQSGIIPTLVAITTELQQKLPDEPYERSHVLYFKGRSFDYLMTKNGFKNLRRNSQLESASKFVNFYINEEEKRFSLKSADNLLEKLLGIANHYGIQLTTEYVSLKST